MVFLLIKNNRRDNWQNTRQIVNYTLLYVEKNSKYESDAISYIKYLIKANNSEISDIETEALLNDVKTKLTLVKHQITEKAFQLVIQKKKMHTNIKF